MKNWLIIWLIIIWILIVFTLTGSIWYYNNLISMQETIKSQHAQVENMYERRTDLVPQIAAVVKKYAEYESSTLKWIVELREASNNLAKLQSMIWEWKVKSAEFDNVLASTLSTIKLTVESYPNLKADTSFMALFTELEWSENRIRTEIKSYNDQVWTYNMKIRSFPYWKIMSMFFGFKSEERITPPEWKDIKAIPDVNNLLK